jgi:hypothetical protein
MIWGELDQSSGDNSPTIGSRVTPDRTFGEFVRRLAYWLAERVKMSYGWLVHLQLSVRRLKNNHTGSADFIRRL